MNEDKWEYPYQTFIEDLEIGHEFHFACRGQEYHISHAEVTYFTREGDPDNSLEFENRMDVLQAQVIDGLTLKELGPDIQMITVY